MVDLLLRTGSAAEIERHVFAEAASLHAPELLDTETLSAVRRWERRGELSDARALEALEDLRDLPIALYPARPLIGRAWELRANLTAADGLYAALAEALGATLLTADAPFAAALRQHTTIPVVQC